MATKKYTLINCFQNIFYCMSEFYKAAWFAEFYLAIHLTFSQGIARSTFIATFFSRIITAWALPAFLRIFVIFKWCHQFWGLHCRSFFQVFLCTIFALQRHLSHTQYFLLLKWSIKAKNQNILKHFLSSKCISHTKYYSWKENLCISWKRCILYFTYFLYF